MKKLLLITIVIAILALSGCSLFGSDEASITSFDVDGIVGTATIDPENHTVTITVEPMDISSIDPEITISDKAVLTEPSSIEDGVPATYTVTAENGDVVEWKVTVTVQYGVSFTLNGTKVVLTKGFKDSSDSVANEALGNGVPGIVRVSTESYTYVLETVYDLDSSNGGLTIDYIQIYIDGITIGEYQNTFRFWDYPDGETPTEFNCDYTVTEYGALGEDFRASFSGTEAVAAPSRAQKSLTNGYAKLLVVESSPS